jgi:cytochrome c-type biogenesis protein CcmH/NrfF
MFANIQIRTVAKHVRSWGNAILLNPPNKCTTILRVVVVIIIINIAVVVTIIISLFLTHAYI